MIIHLTKSKLFTIDPAIRFAKEYAVDQKLWNELWKRYGLLEYDTEGLCGYFQYKTGRKANTRSIRRWLIRTEIYCRAQHVIGMGVQVVDSAYFGKFEDDLLDELTKSMRFSGKRDSRTLL